MEQELTICTELKKIKHKNIVEIYSIIKTDNNTYIFMEYCNMGNLTDYIKNKLYEN